MDRKSIQKKIDYVWEKAVNRETIAYIIAGILTTIVNFICYEGLYLAGVPNLTANAIAWVAAVLFAYAVNKNQVFRSKSDNIRDEAAKIIKFFSARLATFGVEEGGMFLFIDALGFNHLWVKAFLAVFVILLNYFFSKLYIFNKKR